MLVSQIIEYGFPHVYITDKISFALHLMDEYCVQHLPIEGNDKFAGLVSKDVLLEHDETTLIATIADQFINVGILPREHFLTAIKLITGLGDISILPVITESKEMVGVVTPKKLVHAAGIFNSVEEPGGMIVLEMERRNFSFGELSRLIETNDASITQLNTYTDASTGILQATIKVNKIEISDIIATLQRYDYNILYYFGEELYENELKENLDLLMAYLNI